MGAGGSQFLRCSKCCVIPKKSLRERCKEVVRRGGKRLPKKFFSEAFDGIGAFFVMFCLHASNNRCNSADKHGENLKTVLAP